MSLKVKIAVFICSFIITYSFAVAILRIRQPENNFARAMAIQGFNFRYLRTNNTNLSEPKIGEKIELSNFKTLKNETISLDTKKKLLLLLFLDPECQACSFSKDMFQEIRFVTDQISIDYIPVLLRNSKNFNRQRYIEALGFKDCLQLVPDKLMPHSLESIVTPSHVLVKNDGTILQIWFGSDKDETVRKLMSTQISSELQVIQEVVMAIEPKY